MRDVKRYCQGCLKCQQSKESRSKLLGESSPLKPPSRRWGSVASDFIVKLPVTKKGFNAITTFVDRLSKRVHFVPSKEEDDHAATAEVFYTHVFRHHGLPDSIVSDRDPKFTSKFWTELMKMCGVTLKMSTAHHPQTVGASEIMNRMVENYLRCYCNIQQDSWDKLLIAAEFDYNSSISASTGMTPFETDLGWNPKSPLDCLIGEESTNDIVNSFRQRLSMAYEDATFAQAFAAARYSAYNGQKRQPVEYQVGESVWLSRKLFTDAVS